MTVNKEKGQRVLITKSAEAETDLIIKAQRGDRNAFGELVRRHHREVVNVVYRMCGDVQLAEDAAQEAFVRAWLRLESYRPLTTLRNWLYRIAVNAALDMLRRERSTGEDIQSLALHDQQPGPETLLVQKERAALVQAAILSLTPASRTVLVLREYGELSYQEIANILDVPMGTVMSRLNYARNRLRELLAEQLSLLEVENG
jgi:RNA polymerase sigma-70 factor (ECF subfamily)